MSASEEKILHEFHELELKESNELNAIDNQIVEFHRNESKKEFDERINSLQQAPESKRSTESLTLLNNTADNRITSIISNITKSKKIKQKKEQIAVKVDAKLFSQLLFGTKLPSSVYCLEYCLEELLKDKNFRANFQINGLEDSFKQMKTIFQENPNIKKFIFKERINEPTILARDSNMPEDWEEQFIKLLSDTNIKSLEFLNMRSKKSAAYNEYTNNFSSRKNSHKDLLQFLLKLKILGIRELNLGNTIISRSLPSAQKEEQLQGPSGCIETCSVEASVCWILCLPISLCCLTFTNPNCNAPYLDKLNEKNWRHFVEEDRDFLNRFAFSIKDMKIVNINMDRVLEMMARVYLRKPIQQIWSSFNPDKEIVDLTLMSKILQRAKFRTLCLSKFDLSYATPKSRVEFLSSIFKLKHLQVLSLSGCSIYHFFSSELEVSTITQLIIHSNLKMLTGLGVKGMCRRPFKEFIETVFNSNTSIEILDISDEEIIKKSNLKRLEAEKNVFEVESKKLKIIGLQSLDMDHKIAFIESLFNSHKNLKKVDLCPLKLFVFNSHIEQHWDRYIEKMRNGLNEFVKILNQSNITRISLLRGVTERSFKGDDLAFLDRLKSFVIALQDNEKIIELDDFNMPSIELTFKQENSENLSKEALLFLEITGLVEKLIKRNQKAFIRQELQEINHDLTPAVPIILGYANYINTYKDGTVDISSDKKILNEIKNDEKDNLSLTTSNISISI